MSFEKPFAPAVERNQAPILQHLRRLLKAPVDVLEIGSGTGQHAVHFAEQLPNVQWQTSDLDENHAGINAWLQDAGLPNVLPPLSLDVSIAEAWPDGPYDVVFSANAIHIMSWSSAQAMLAGVGRVLRLEGLLILYGPFNYNGQFTSDSNAQFDQSLKARNPASGIRDFEALERCLNDAGLYLAEDNPMPANNRLLVFAKSDDL